MGDEAHEETACFLMLECFFCFMFQRETFKPSFLKHKQASIAGLSGGVNVLALTLYRYLQIRTHLHTCNTPGFSTIVIRHSLS